jgi:hypothetical protein
MSTTRSLLAALSAYFALIGGAAPASDGFKATGPLHVHPANQRYFTDGSGRAIYLTGSHTWSNFKDMDFNDPPAAFDYAAYLDFMERNHHNFIRLWAWDLTTFRRVADKDNTLFVQPFAWRRTGPGNALDDKPKFDMTALDPSYFDRLRSRVVDAGKRGIYVSVMLFEGYGLHGYRKPWCWLGNPLNVENNINGLNGDPNDDGRGFETHTLQVPAITAVQEAYVRRILDTLNDLDSVLYEITNESGNYSIEWQYHMIRLVHDYERRLPKQHPVGMTFQFCNIKTEAGKNQTLFDSPADWISPNPEGGYRDNPPAADGRKVIISDTDHLWGIGGDRKWVWKTFLRGGNPIWMDPYLPRPVLGGKPIPANADDVRKNMGYTLRFAERMNLAAMTPRNELAASGYCLANPGREYLVYLPDGGATTVDLTDATYSLQAEWFNPQTGELKRGDVVDGGDKHSFAAPFDGDAVLYLRALVPDE